MNRISLEECEKIENADFDPNKKFVVQMIAMALPYLIDLADRKNIVVRKLTVEDIIDEMKSAKIEI